MSFRIKTTHQLLDSNPQEKGNEKPGLSFFDSDNSLININYVTAEKKDNDNRPRDSNNKGMAVRTVNTSVPDRM